jgi:hypothetical protein
MKTKLERFVLGLILAPPAPLALFLGGWWGTYEFLPGKWIPFGAICGLLLGILTDILILKKLIDRVDKLGMVFWTAVYLFYTMGVLGFSMGVPVFNILLSLPAGFIVGRRLAVDNADLTLVRKSARRTAWFSTGILALVCAVSAFLALLSKSTASDMQGMLGLRFEITSGMIIGLILVGVLVLLVMGWGLAVVAVRFSYTLLHEESTS